MFTLSLRITRSGGGGGVTGCGSVSVLVRLLLARFVLSPASIASPALVGGGGGCRTEMVALRLAGSVSVADPRLPLKDFLLDDVFSSSLVSLRFELEGGGGGTRSTAPAVTGGAGKGRPDCAVEEDARLTTSSANSFFIDLTDLRFCAAAFAFAFALVDGGGGGGGARTIGAAGVDTGGATGSFSRNACTIRLPRRKLSLFRFAAEVEVVFVFAVPAVL